MALQLPDEQRSAVEALDSELLAAAQAMGLGLLPRLEQLRPGMTGVDAASGPPVLERLSLDPEDAPDPVSLAAILAAHTAYARSRGDADGVSIGALSIARLLVWAHRAAMLGPAPEIVWIGPVTRAPVETPGVRLEATTSIRSGDARRTARAVAVLRRPEA